DLLHLFEGVTTKTLGECDLHIDSRSAATVMAVSQGYPESYEKGKEISGLDAVEESIIFHAGTKKSQNKIVTNGGRVLTATSLSTTIYDALDYSYEAIETINFKGKYFRTDLGVDLRKFFKEK
ncbi:MAG: phosphoribosylglycinamide synthetase C domain-containing protein, partial [Bacteroidota bacterium]